MGQQELSKNQKLFVKDAKRQGFEVDYGYSGRGMYGLECPAVRCDCPGDFGTKAGTHSDAMGKGIVIYCPN